MTSKDDALTEDEFTELYSKATSLKDKIMILMLGVVGLRAGELAHMKSSWFRWQEGKFRIPNEQPCTIGNKGKSCYDCKTPPKKTTPKDPKRKPKPRKKWKKGFWTPKSKAGSRGLKIEPMSPELWVMCRKYFAVQDNYGRTRQTIDTQLKKLAEDTELHQKIHAHGLRATAATRLSRIFKTPDLKQWMGWEKLDTAEVYVGDYNLDQAVEEAFK